jgi:hypothetical protein
VLEGLRRSTNLGTVALRSLVSDSLRRKDSAAATAWSAQLFVNPHCTAEDRLQHLNLLLPGNGPDFTFYLESLKQRAGTNVTEVRGPSAWLIQHHRAAEALRWLTNLPPAVRARQPVPLATTETYAALTNWPAMERFLADQPWADMEFMRLAFMSQASLQKRGMASQNVWRSAVLEAGDRLGPQIALFNLADSWQRSKDKEDLLWEIYRRHPAERWALGDLGAFYRAGRNTLGLNKVFAALAELNPKDLPARNNLAATSLLLNLGVQRGIDLAKELHAQQPDDALFASTYAFALHVRGRTPDGLEVLQKLKPEALEDPPVALYYGVLLSAVKQTDKAKKYLDLGQRAPLLPEEQVLLETARNGL